MSKKELDDILLANWYYVKCEFEKPECQKTKLARKFLACVIKKVLTRKDKTFKNKK